MAMCVGLAPPLEAQQGTTVRPGERIRVSMRCEGQMRPRAAACPGPAAGTLVRLLDDGLVLERADSTVIYPFASVALVEAVRGSATRWKAGGLIGVLAGTAVAFAVLNSSGGSSTTNMCDPGSNQDAIGGTGACLLVAGVAGGLPGGLLGAFVGSFMRTERWEAVRLGSVPMLSVSVPVPW